MYLYLGQETVVPMREVVGIFDMENTTISKSTRDLLSEAEKQGRVVTVSTELPKSFVVCVENGKRNVYISQLSSQTLIKRTKFLKKLSKKNFLHQK